MTRLTLSLLFLLCGPVAFAQDDSGSDDASEDDLDSEETEEEKKAREEAEKKRLDDDDELDLIDDEEELDGLDSTDDSGDDLLGAEIEKDVVDADGADNSKIYLAASEEFGELATDEEMLAWDRYLKEYPKSVYKDRIERHLDDLEALLYKERHAREDDSRLDNDRREVPISQGLFLTSLNTRSKATFGFEWGLPSYMNLIAVYEHQVQRNWTVHGGVRNRYQTWGFEFGTHYALVKSSRTRTLVTAMGDFRFAMNPAYLAVRPQIAVGKSIGVVDIQAQAGIDYELRKFSSVRLIGGANITVRADENVSVFFESIYNAKNLSWEEGKPFMFNQASFGFKFFPKVENQPDGFMEVNLGASVPYATRYYRWHQGSVQGQVNFNL
ncbi:MAG: hypothetical protein ACI9MC_002036 [Kiritimatiellia bacterium]|jgi:hypothetical protein